MPNLSQEELFLLEGLSTEKGLNTSYELPPQEPAELFIAKFSRGKHLEGSGDGVVLPSLIEPAQTRGSCHLNVPL